MSVRDRYAKLSFSLPSHVAERLRETGNQSQYLSRVLDDRWRDWTTALDTLAAVGWTAEQISLAAGALSQAGIVSGAGEWLVGRVHGAIAHLDLPLADFTEAVAFALVVCAREYQTYNDAFDAALRRLDPTPRTAVGTT